VPSTQALLAQRWVGPQACPQAPQSELLLVVSTQAVPHPVCPAAQEDVQAPLLHTWFAWHVVAQLPQWLASDTTHEPPHSSSPAWHPHWPAWHVRPFVQGMPQAPQFAGSVVVSTHSCPQCDCPAEHGFAGVPPAPPLDFPLVAPTQAAPTKARPIAIDHVLVIPAIVMRHD
jgi:hypothetical protein